jgi:outer membrane protein W
MKRILFFLCVMMMTNLLFAQTGFNMGVSFNYAPSTLINATSPQEIPALDFDFKLKNSIGGQLDFAYFINPVWSIIASAGYLQRGATFANPEAEYLPRYRFSYLDFSLGTTYHFNLEKRYSPFVSLSLTQHNLLTASLKNSFEELTIKDDISTTDVGLLLAVGTDYKLSTKKTIQLSLFYNQGFVNVFNGIYRENGLKAFNSVFGIRAGYSFGVMQKKLRLQNDNNTP